MILGHLLQALGFSSMLLLPLYLDGLGANRTEIGTIMALSAVGGLTSRPLVGWALDAWGRKPTLLVGTAFLATAMGLMFFVRDLGWLIYADRILLGIGSGALFAGYFTWATDMIPESRRTEGVAFFGVSGLVPLMLNAFVDDVGLSGPGLRYLFPALGGLIALSAFCLLALREEPREKHPPEDDEAQSGTRAVLRALTHRSLWPTWLATSIFAGLVGVFMAFATVTAQSRGAADPADLWFTYALGACGLRLVGARFPDYIGPSNLVAPSLCLYLAGMALLTMGWSSTTFVLAGLLAGLGHGACFPVLISQVVTRSPARWRGSALAMFTAVWQTSELVLTPIFGAIADYGGDTLMYGCASLAATVAVALWAVLEHLYAPTDQAPPS